MKRRGRNNKKEGEGNMRKRSLFNGAGLCSLAVALAVIVGWAAVVSAATNYWMLTEQAWTAFENARQPVRG